MKDLSLLESIKLELELGNSDKDLNLLWLYFNYFFKASLRSVISKFLSFSSLVLSFSSHHFCALNSDELTLVS